MACGGSTSKHPLVPGRVRLVARAQAPKGLGKLEWDAPVVSATFFVGRDKGHRPENRSGFCKSQPARFPEATVDERIRALRSLRLQAHGATKEQAHAEFAASKVKQTGWYKGRKEPSAAYTVFHDPSLPGEATEADFRKSMRFVAENVSALLCQDEVLVVFDTPSGKRTESYSADEAERAQAPAIAKAVRKRKR